MKERVTMYENILYLPVYLKVTQHQLQKNPIIATPACTLQWK